MYTCLTMSLTCLTMTLTACPVGATWVGVLRAFGPAPVGGLRPQGGLRPNKIVEEGGVCAMVTASHSLCSCLQANFHPPYAHPMSVNCIHLQALQLPIVVWP